MNQHLSEMSSELIANNLQRNLSGIYQGDILQDLLDSRLPVHIIKFLRTMPQNNEQEFLRVDTMMQRIGTCGPCISL